MLTPKQELFVKYYLIDLNATQAAIKAGYSRDTARQIGSENLTKPDIAAAIQDALDMRAAKVQITADDILRDIIEIKDRCMQKEMVMEYDKVSGEYVPTGEWKFNEAGALKAVELLGKHKKLFTDSKVDLDVNMNFKLEDIMNEE